MGSQCYIVADVLNCLMDGKRHTVHEIAEKVEISDHTARRYIHSLAHRFPIRTMVGGRDKGGVILDKTYIHKGKILSKEEIEIIIKALTLLKDTNNKHTNNELLTELIEFYSLKE